MEKLVGDLRSDALLLSERRKRGFAAAQRDVHPPFSQRCGTNRTAEAGGESSVPCVSC